MTIVSYVSPASAKLQEKVFDFDGTSFSFSTTKNTYVDSTMVDDAMWRINCGKDVSASKAMNGYIPEGFESAQRFVLPKKTSSSTSYLQLSTDALGGLLVKRVMVYAWVHSTTRGNISLSVQTTNSNNIAGQSFNVADVFPITTETQLETYSVFSQSLDFTGSFVPDNRLRLYFVNNSTSAGSSIALARVVVEYDDGIKDPIDLSFSVDGESVESGCTVSEGSVLTVSAGEVENAVIAYTIGDSTIDDLYPTEGIVLNSPGTYEYHFTVSADGFETSTKDFLVTVEGEEDGLLEVMDFVDYEKYGLSLFPTDSDEYQSDGGETSWVVDNVTFIIPMYQKIRMEESSDGIPTLMMEPNSMLYIDARSNHYNILSASVEGLNVDDIIIEEESEDFDEAYPSSFNATPLRKSVKWNSKGDKVSVLRMVNGGDTPVGLSKVTLSLDKDVETSVNVLNEFGITSLECYDLMGRKVCTGPDGLPSVSGVYVVRDSSSSRLIVVR